MAGADAFDGFVVHGPDAAYQARPPAPADASAYVAYLRRNWARFRGVMPTESATTFEAGFYRRRFAGAGDAAAAPTALTLVLMEQDGRRGRIVGDISFSNIVGGPFRACHVGFKLDRELEGRGIMRGALEAACETMFIRFGLHRIMGNYRPDNLRSAALLKRLGFEVEGFARAYLHLDGAWRDHVLTSLVRPDEE